MESLNKTKILNLIRLYGPISRTSLSEMMEVSMTAISKYVAELLSEEIVKETGTQMSSGGRKPILLNINSDYGYIVGIDFGQNYLRVAALTLENEIISISKIPTSDLGPSHEGIPLLIQMIKEKMNCLDPGKRLLAIGIAVSGIISGDEAGHINMPNLENWTDVDFVSPLRSEFGVPTFLDDSARMMALCESVVPGKGRHRDLVYVSIGAGIGTGIISFGRLLRGINGTAGELGHIIVQEHGLPCGCGNEGCLEQYASVTSMVNNAKRFLREGVRSSILDYANGDIDAVDSYCLAKAYQEQDKLASRIITEAGTFLGVGISLIINILNPPLILLGGGGINISTNIADIVSQTCNLRALTTSVRNTKIIVSDSSDEKAVIGASIFAQDNLFDLWKIYDNNFF